MECNASSRCFVRLLTQGALRRNVHQMTMASVVTPMFSVLTTLCVAFVVPLLVLFTDYLFRADLNLEELLRKAGADLCLLGLGSSGAVFIEPRVSAAFGLAASLIQLLSVLFVFLFRALCLRIERGDILAKCKYANLYFGVASICMMGGILIYSYWVS
jgi:hypothetical protein